MHTLRTLREEACRQLNRYIQSLINTAGLTVPWKHKLQSNHEEF